MSIPLWLFVVIILMFLWLFRPRSHGRHTHKCPSCGHIWEHGAEARGNIPAHRCEKCGTLQGCIHEFV